MWNSKDEQKLSRATLLIVDDFLHTLTVLGCTEVIGVKIAIKIKKNPRKINLYARNSIVNDIN